MPDKKIVTVAHGDGIGPEIMQATLNIIKATGAPIEFEEIEMGEKVYLSGNTTGIPQEAWNTIRRNRAFLKAPITTPQGGGYKSLNVTIRKTLGLFANVRPCKTFKPYIPANCNDMDMVIIRENEEDLYAGIEHQGTNELFESLKIISKPGSERIIRYAFEYAKLYQRKKLTCMTKDNIMKLSDGEFHKIFDKISSEYPEIEKEHRIIDIGSALVATNPENLDVVVTLNLYGDIISDIMAQVAGSVGLSGSSNIGRYHAMFEAIHGSAPDIAGKNIANPCGLIHASILMLDYVGLSSYAKTIEAASLKVLEEGIHTGDLFRQGFSKKLVGTKEFSEAVIERIGQEPTHIKIRERNAYPIQLPEIVITKKTKSLVGVDISIDWDFDDRNPNILGDEISKLPINKLKLKTITNRGVKVYPDSFPESYKTDHWILRFYSEENITNQDILDLMATITNSGFDIIKSQNLYNFDGVRGYSLGQGE